MRLRCYHPANAIRTGRGGGPFRPPASQKSYRDAIVDLTELIARLDWDRFLELFEYVALTAHGLPYDVQSTLRPLEMPGVDLYGLTASHVASAGSWIQAWCFQIAFAPRVDADARTTVAFLRDELRRGLTQLASHPNVLAALKDPFPLGGQSSRFEAVPEGWNYYLATNVCTAFDPPAHDRFAVGAKLAYREILGAGDEPRIEFTTTPLMAAQAPGLDRFAHGLLARQAGAMRSVIPPRTPP